MTPEWCAAICRGYEIQKTHNVDPSYLLESLEQEHLRVLACIRSIVSGAESAFELDEKGDSRVHITYEENLAKKSFM